MVRIQREFWFNEEGATAIEYGLIASGVFLAIVGVVFALGGSVSGAFTSVSAGFS